MENKPKRKERKEIIRKYWKIKKVIWLQKTAINVESWDWKETWKLSDLMVFKVYFVKFWNSVQMLKSIYFNKYNSDVF